MRLVTRFRSYRWFLVARIVLPLVLVIFALVSVGGYLYQNIITTLLIERHRQLASLMAASVSQVLDSYADVLEATGSQFPLENPEQGRLDQILGQASGALEVFNGGVVVVDHTGSVIDESAHTAIRLGPSVQDLPVFRLIQSNLTPGFGDLQVLERQGEEYFIVAVPLAEADGSLAGALLGILDLQTAAFGEPLRQFTADEARHAYLVDQSGTIIFHPDDEEIGRDLGDRPFVVEMSAGRSGGMLTRGLDGERLVEGFAPIPGTDWGLIVQESWASVSSPLRTFDAVIVLIGAVVAGAVVFLAWRSVEQVIGPIQWLAKQSTRLADEEQIEPPEGLSEESGIQEIDALERAFYRMAKKVSDYRAGLHRYVGAITRSQEDERRRIARDLHDETVQGLLAMNRHLELYQSQTTDADHLERLDTLKTMVNDLIVGVRQINRDLRPLILEDLGLVPALQTLVREAHRGIGAVREAEFELRGESDALGAEQELTLYRITQEALANVRKHAEAESVRVDLIFDDHEVQLEIRDDGVGFEVPTSMTDFARRGNYGLLGIQERVWAVGGTASIRSSPGAGVHLSITMPARGSDDSRVHPGGLPPSAQADV